MKQLKFLIIICLPILFIQFSCTSGNEKQSANPLASLLEIEWEAGIKEKLAKLERVQILFEDGKHVMLYCASGTIGEFPANSFNIHIPLKMEETDK